MKNHINLYWYKHPSGKNNFGDVLNPYLIEKLSGSKPKYVDIKFLFNDKFVAAQTLCRLLLKRRMNLGVFFKFFYFNFIAPPRVLLAIGSILQFSKISTFDVWGSGIIDYQDNFANNNFIAVRGKYTQNKLRDLGYQVADVVGDPALLLPLVYTPRFEKKYKVGIIPHYSHYNQLKNNFPNDGIVINLFDDIETVINQISSCDFTLSTSLHGIIVSHAYEIPSLWTNFNDAKTKLHGDDIKFNDYFSSVNIKEYRPLNITEIKSLNDEKKLSEIFILFKDELLPNKEVVTQLQENLLKVAPFTIKKSIYI